MRINCIERVLIGVADLEAARERWSHAGFAIASDQVSAGGIAFARMAAGGVEIDLCAAGEGASGPLADAIRSAAARGGGILGWIWGTVGEQPASGESISIPSAVAGRAIAGARMLPGGSAQLPGVFTASAEVGTSHEARRVNLGAFGANENTVAYLDHIVVMTPILEDAIAAHEAIGVPCKRIREVGNGTRQAFFKLEQTVLEVVGPARGEPGCWGLAFMCTDIAHAVSVARASGMQATEPKTAIQGGKIARIIDPLDGVAVAFMEPPPAPAA
ncbi:MAG: VOC family protein [Candidatus Binataceae bacterium]